MAKTTGDVIVEKLLAWGVDTAFGLPGDGINGIFEALRKNREKIRFIQCRHEEAAAFAACGYAKFTGRLGVCFATSGPGAIHLLNGLYDAKLDHAPVLAITGHTYHDQIGTLFQQEIDILALFKDVADYNQMILGPKHAARAGRPRLPLGPVDPERVAPDLPRRHPGAGRPRTRLVDADGRGPHLRRPGGRRSSCRSGDARGAPRSCSTPARRLVILAGLGALGAADELERLADVLAAPIVKPLLGKACVPDDSPFTTGGIGLLGTRPSEQAMEECDGLFLVGTSFPYLKWYPKPGQARAVQLDIDPTRIGLRYPVDIGLVGDAKATLQALLPLLKPKTGPLVPGEGPGRDEGVA